MREKQRNLDTITAIATPSGRGGVGIVRVSGKEASAIAFKIIKTFLQPRVAHFTVFYDAVDNIIDEGIALFFKNPHSFTGEDVIELQSHGSPIVLDCLLKTAIHHGARLARPGEFSERAFLNGKIDLTQAEAIADLIASTSDQAARFAGRSLQGEFSKKIHMLQEALTHLRMQVEALIDFSDEEIDFASHPTLLTLLQKTIDDIISVKNQAKQGVLLQQGVTVVLAGKPNVGKSSLLNYFSGCESAIVTHIPGTTRDVLRETINLDGMPLHMIDTAGLRETTDIVEQEGMRRAYQQLEQADIALLLMDAADTQKNALDDFKKILKKNIPIIIVKNKIDLTGETAECVMHENITEVKISIIENQGLSLLTDALKKIVGFQPAETDGFIARCRHVDAIERAHHYLLAGQKQLNLQKALELLAEDLRGAQLVLSEITGEFTSDDLLGKIFSSFCVGK